MRTRTRYGYLIVISALMLAQFVFPSVGAAAQLKLGWDYTQGTENQAVGFNIYRQASCTGSFAKVNPFLIPVGTTTFTDTGLLPGALYCWQATAQGAGGEESTPSNVFRFQMPPGLPSAPTSLRMLP